jgi:ribose 5-phosphate isomerase A
MTAADSTALKRAAAVRAVEEVRSGMVVGLGSGSTAELAVEALGRKVESGLEILGVPTSEQTRRLATRFRIPLAPAKEVPVIDLTIDGADQVERKTLAMVKGLGGALLREKIVASASKRMIVVVDQSKIVDNLGGATPLPIEIVSFGWQRTIGRLADLGLAPTLRQAGRRPFVTDGGNLIADCAIPRIDEAKRLDQELSALTGVVETGLFLEFASTVIVGVIVGGQVGLEELER